MKQKISITLDEDKLKALDQLAKGSRFRSKSHIIEYSLNKFLEEENGKSL